MSTTTTELIGSANDLLAAHAALLSRVRQSQQNHRRKVQNIQPPPLELLRLPLLPSPLPSPTSPAEDSSPPRSPTESRAQRLRHDLPPAKRARAARYKNYVPEEETIRNDYSQRYVDGGEWPQNWVLGADPEHRFEEYPKQQRLLNLKKISVANHALPPHYLSFSELNTLIPCKFDVILLDPPFSSSFTWEHLQELPIPALAADPSFIFLWIGSGAGEGLERGREVLAKWGYRRCEDVVWVKTNKTSNKGPGTDPPTTSLLTRTKQHCLIGIRGTVRRSSDSWFVHCNVDTDVIIWEGDPCDPMRKPPEMYTLIENFCLGTRRLEVFGRASSSLRRGWVTVLGQVEEEQLNREMGSGGTMFVDGDEGGEAVKWERERWDNGIKELANGGKAVVPMTADIETLRPKSPFRPGASGSNALVPGVSGNGAGGGGGGGGSSGGVVMGIPNSNLGPRMGGGAARGGFMGGQGNMAVHRPTPGQNQMMTPQPMMGMRMGVNALGMDMGNGMGMDGMMGAGWPNMMNVANMGGMNGMGGMGGGMGMPLSMGVGGAGGMGGGMGNAGMAGGMDGGFQQGANFAQMNGIPMFNAGMGSMGWGDQGQFAMDGSWDGESMMNVNVNGLPGMNMGPSMGMGQWGQ